MNTNKSVYETPNVSNPINRYIITVLVDNEPGVLARVVGMFSGRGYNIDSLNVAEVVTNEHLSRITIVTHGTSEVVDLIRKQLMTIVPVHSVTNLENEGSPVEAEVALIYLEINESNKKEAFNVCDFYRARKIENENNTTIFEIAGTSERIDAFIKEINKLAKIEVVRSGPIAISSLERKMEEK
ncbi:MAG: Acetolactate synthase isozyme 3 small subunit [Alphaproteobacteria bacterium MarineAlpha5_Bin8]|nr:MAG: Acetolactate synthase isozyme 3 small subunit [Alphaproteobacteria bacterium MarineAlpha5_Bin7]PPR48218.1 MAG: Acetolactate synthase isozyme 3 small subunit [Alphaproteobacteria bacterium MarineAlpha5_Bin8]PPR53070.1 MAG: Acetolactate synthase isozyme 3 small subunit [Alphaproteobacteria bacterium MarineAlpha5_Bin6]|tara:strand:+ start:2240 stop:2791 length:552 start_codon:yes stop_codon:yes gene_type:complete